MKTKRFVKKIFTCFMVVLMSFSVIDFSNISIKTTLAASPIQIGSARSDHDRKSGDSKGTEVAPSYLYLTNGVYEFDGRKEKDIYVLRPTGSGDANEIAECIEKAIKNNNIGYSQSNRLTTINKLIEIGKKNKYKDSKKIYNPSNIKTKVDVDCSSLVGIAVNYAGIKVNVKNFNTGNEKDTLKQTGKFKVIKSPTELKRGDIIVTTKKGHTVVVLKGGKVSSKTTSTTTLKEPTVNLKEGSKGDGVKWLQTKLNQLVDKKKLTGEKVTVDGQWGPKTSALFKNFQKKYPETGTNGKPDGVCGKKARDKIKSLL